MASPTPAARSPYPGRRLPRPVRQFLDTEASAGILLLAAAVVALLWANSPWKASYTALWHTDVTVNVGRYVLAGDLHHWVNDGLMVVFFLVVGLEIKRELVDGKLRDPKNAAMPAIAAMGGMVVPAALYFLVTAGGAGSRGWGIPMATDIAFAVGVVTLLGPRVPAAVKLFLLTLAIVDDIGAIIVIGVFYPTGIEPKFLLLAAGLIVAIVVANRLGVVSLIPYLLLGVGLWLATDASGVHATIAGVLLGLLTPARTSADDLDAVTGLARHSVSPCERIASRLHPWSSFVVVPVFALANAGVEIRADAFDAPGAAAVTAGVMLGLVVGKAVGILGAAWLAVRVGVARIPEGANWRIMAAVAGVGGIGFTVSLFVAELAFEPGALQDAAKLGVLAGSTVAAIAGGLALRRTCRRPAVTTDAVA